MCNAGIFLEVQERASRDNADYRPFISALGRYQATQYHIASFCCFFSKLRTERREIGSGRREDEPEIIVQITGKWKRVLKGLVPTHSLENNSKMIAISCATSLS